MRIWTIHPELLDAKGLVALWRETLLAQKVLQGATKGYRHHPQLRRFQNHAEPLAALATYLVGVADEATRRGYSFDRSKIAPARSSQLIEETDGQLAYEWQHLLQKLKQRDPERFERLRSVEIPRVHPLFCVVPGAVRDWERVVLATKLPERG